MDPLDAFPLRPPVLYPSLSEDDLRLFLEAVEGGEPDAPGPPPLLVACVLGLLAPLAGPVLVVGADPGIVAAVSQFATEDVSAARLAGGSSTGSLDLRHLEFSTGRPRPLAVPLVAGPFEETPMPLADGRFGAVVCHDTLERCDHDPAGLLDDLARVLVPDGLLVVVTPNAARLEHVAGLAAGEPVLPPLDPDATARYARVVREYTPTEVRDLIDDAGHVVERSFTADVGPNEARGIHRLVPILRVREHDLGQFVFVKARRGS